MSQRILYASLGDDRIPSGTLVVVAPTGELPIEVVARKDVPQGVPYKIVDLSEIEDTISDRTFRAAWEADFGTPDGYGDPDGYWAEKEAERLAEEARIAAQRAAAMATQEPEQ